MVNRQWYLEKQGVTKIAVESRVRLAAEADRDTLADLIVRAFADVTTNRRREKQFGAIGGRPWEEWEADIMRTIDVSKVMIAEVAGKAVGFATYELDDSTRVGAQLLACVLKQLEEAGMEFAQVTTGLDEPYAPARRMYERQGFTPYFRSICYMKKLAQDTP